jgi:hypothetical protein
MMESGECLQDFYAKLASISRNLKAIAIVVVSWKTPKHPNETHNPSQAGKINSKGSLRTSKETTFPFCQNLLEVFKFGIRKTFLIRQSSTEL